MDYQQLVEQVKSSPRYRKNIEYGSPRLGHPEGLVKHHIAELEANLEKLKPRLRDEDEYWKLEFLIHVHDTFKAEALPDRPTVVDPRGHASLARQFASELIDDHDLLNMIQYHDENYALWRQFESMGQYDQQRMLKLIDLIQDWDLFLTFMIIDGSSPGKDIEKLHWFIAEFRKYGTADVDETWLGLG